MKKYLITPIIFMILSCSTNSNNNSEPATGGIVVGTSALFHLKDTNGNNLIGTEKYPINGIYGEYLINGKIVTTKDIGSAINPDNPNILQVRTENNDTYAKVSVNSAETEEFPITYIHWNDTETDTIKVQIKRITSGGGMWVEKLWVFKNNAWEEQLSGEITFVK